VMCSSLVVICQRLESRIGNNMLLLTTAPRTHTQIEYFNLHALPPAVRVEVKTVTRWVCCPWTFPHMTNISSVTLTILEIRSNMMYLIRCLAGMVFTRSLLVRPRLQAMTVLFQVKHLTTHAVTSKSRHA